MNYNSRPKNNEYRSARLEIQKTIPILEFPIDKLFSHWMSLLSQKNIRMLGSIEDSLVPVAKEEASTTGALCRSFISEAQNLFIGRSYNTRGCSSD